jgi:hypothetical protein
MEADIIYLGNIEPYGRKVHGHVAGSLKWIYIEPWPGGGAVRIEPWQGGIGVPLVYIQPWQGGIGVPLVYIQPWQGGG